MVAVPSIVQQALAAKLPSLEAALFRPGQELEALVLGQTSEGLTQIRIGTLTLTALLPEIPEPGTVLHLAVKAAGSPVQLAIIAEKPPGTLPTVLPPPGQVLLPEAVLPSVSSASSAPIAVRGQSVAAAGSKIESTPIALRQTGVEAAMPKLVTVPSAQVSTPTPAKVAQAPARLSTPQAPNAAAPLQPVLTPLQGFAPPVALLPITQTLAAPLPTPGTSPAPLPGAAAQPKVAPTPVAPRSSVPATVAAPVSPPTPSVSPPPAVPAPVTVATTPSSPGTVAPSPGLPASPPPSAAPAPSPALTTTVGTPPPAVSAQSATPQQALAQMIPVALSNQGSIGTLLQALAVVAARGIPLPEPVARAATQVLAGRVAADGGQLTGQVLKTTIEQSGVLLEAGLAKAMPQAADGKSALLALRSALSTWLGGDPAPIAPVRKVPPPIKGAEPRMQIPDLPPMPDAPRELGRVLHSHTEAALSRLKLLQLASLPDAAPQRPGGPEFRLELPLLIGPELAMLQLQIQRDGRRRERAQQRGWVMRFALHSAATGEVGAEIALHGRAISVALWAVEAETALAFERALPELSASLAALGLDPGAIRCRSGAPHGLPASGQLLERVS